MGTIAKEYFTLGFELACEGEWSKAVKMINKGLKLEPENKCAILNRCACYAKMHRFPAALQDAALLASMDPTDNSGYLLAGNAIVEAGFGVYAEDAYDAAITIRPDDPAAYVGRASAYMKQGKADQALKDHEHALTLDPTLIEAQFGYARALSKLGKLEQAAEAYEKLLSMIDKKSCPIAKEARAELKALQKSMKRDN